MAAFADALDLKFAVGDLVGNRSISDVWGRLVQMAETALNQKLRVRQMITDATLTFDEGAAPLPPDFLEIIHVYGPCGYQMRAGSLAAYLRPGSCYSQYEIGPYNITVRGFSGDKDIQYFAKLPSLAHSLSSCNWLLSCNPDVYLYAVGLQAAKHLKDVEIGQAADQLLAAALQSLKIDDERARFSNSIVRVQGMTP